MATFWRATIDVTVEWRDGPEGTRWSCTDFPVSMTGTTQRDAKERLSDYLAKLAGGRETYGRPEGWPTAENARVISIDVSRAPRMERV